MNALKDERVFVEFIGECLGEEVEKTSLNGFYTSVFRSCDFVTLNKSVMVCPKCKQALFWRSVHQKDTYRDLHFKHFMGPESDENAQGVGHGVATKRLNRRGRPKKQNKDGIDF